jgi:hypothetical protein
MFPILHLLLVPAACIAALTSALAWYIADMMLRPPWYRDKVKGHYSRDMTIGGALPKAVIGDATFTWRISAEVDGLGDPQVCVILPYCCNAQT